MVHNDKMCLKPLNHDDADRMLTTLSGKTHSVITAVCLLFIRDGKVQDRIIFDEETRVHLADLSPDVIRAYVDSEEPM